MCLKQDFITWDSSLYKHFVAYKGKLQKGNTNLKQKHKWMKWNSWNDNIKKKNTSTFRKIKKKNEQNSKHKGPGQS